MLRSIVNGSKESYSEHNQFSVLYSLIIAVVTYIVQNSKQQSFFFRINDTSNSTFWEQVANF